MSPITSPTPDEFFNYDIFALKVATAVIRRLTATESVESAPRWSPDGKRISLPAPARPHGPRNQHGRRARLADGRRRIERHEVGTIDNRQGLPHWSPEGSAVYFTVQERGNVRLYRQAGHGRQPEMVIERAGAVGGFSVAGSGAIAYTFSGPPQDMAELYLKNGAGAAAKQLTDLNAESSAASSSATSNRSRSSATTTSMKSKRF